MWTTINELEHDHSVLFRECIELAKDKPEIITDLIRNCFWPIWEDSLRIQYGENLHAEKLVYELTSRHVPEDTARAVTMRFHRLAILDQIYFGHEPGHLNGWQRLLEGENIIDVQTDMSRKKLPAIYQRLHHRDALAGLK